MLLSGKMEESTLGLTTESGGFSVNGPSLILPFIDLYTFQHSNSLTGSFLIFKCPAASMHMAYSVAACQGAAHKSPFFATGTTIYR